MEPDLQPKSIILESIESLSCPICSKVLSTKYNVRQHVRKFHPEVVPPDDNLSGNPEDGQKGKNCQCSICFEHFTSINYLRRHISKMHQAKENLLNDKVHEEKDQIQNAIELSDNTQAENVDLNIMSVDSKKKSTTEDKILHQCTICLKFLATSDSLRRHMRNKTVHEQKEKIDDIVGSTCPICDRTFSNKHNVRRHMLKNVCNGKNKEKQNVDATETPVLIKDTSTVTETPRIQPVLPVEPWRQREMACKICNFKTYYLDNYYLHRKTPKHLEKQRFRKMQKERFTRRFFRRLKKLAGLRYRQFRCFKCKFNSMCKSVIVFHRNYRHKKMKPFQCSLCTKSYFLSRKLEIHMVKVHTALKPKRCFVSKCKRTFVSNDLYGKHLSCVHKTEVSIKDKNIIEEEEDDDIVEVEIVNLVKMPSTVPFVIQRTSSIERRCRFCKVICFNEVALINHLLRHGQLLTANAKLTKGRTKNSKLKGLTTKHSKFKCSAKNSKLKALTNN